jgi:hypothetical protein
MLGVADIQGAYDELFTAVPSVLAGLLDDGDTGGSVAVFVDGEPVVDVWGGFADAERTAGWPGWPRSGNRGLRPVTTR